MVMIQPEFVAIAARCSAVMVLASHGGIDDSELEAVIADVQRLPDLPMTGRLAVGLIRVLLKRDPGARPYILRISTVS